MENGTVSRYPVWISVTEIHAAVNYLRSCLRLFFSYETSAFETEVIGKYGFSAWVCLFSCCLIDLVVSVSSNPSNITKVHAKTID